MHELAGLMTGLLAETVAALCEAVWLLKQVSTATQLVVGQVAAAGLRLEKAAQGTSMLTTKNK